MRSNSRPALHAALDEVSFGAARTLNLRATLPTAAEAAERAEQWLRQQQAAKAGDVLVITGRGNNSPGGVSAVRESVVKRFYSLRRRGVVAAWREHTPGSFVVELAPLTALFEPMPRRREPRPRAKPVPASLQALGPETNSALRALATRSLEALGVRHVDAFVEAEMVKQFSALSAAIGEEGDPESALRVAIAHALEELEH